MIPFNIIDILYKLDYVFVLSYNLINIFLLIP